MHFPQIHGGFSGKGSPSGRAGERSETERARMLTTNPRHSDSIALTKSLPIAAPAALSCRACPLRHCFAMPPLPKGEALAGRVTFHWTTEARQDAKGRALLQRAAASGQRSLSSCRWPRQRSTTVSEILCFARPDESRPTCQWLPLWGNGDDRRQWRKQGGAVGAAASKTQAERGGCWEPQPGLGGHKPD